MGPVLHCGAGPGAGGRPWDGVRPQGRETREHATGREGTPETGGLWDVHESGQGREREGGERKKVTVGGKGEEGKRIRERN